jgi:tetratricopeptide (TPR) repeat protein
MALIRQDGGVSIPPMTSDPRLTEAEKAFANGARDDGLSHLRAVLSDKTVSFSTFQAAGRLFWAQDAWSEAVAASNRADAVDPLDSDFQSIRRAISQNNLAEAERIAERMLLSLPGHPRALYTLAHVARIRRRPTAFLAHVQAGLETAPGNMILRHMLVSALEATGRDKEAFSEAKRLPEIERSPASILELGRLFQRFGHNEDLIRLFEEAARTIVFTPEQRGGMDLVMGHALRVLGRREEAEAAYKRAIASQTPATPEAWWALSDFTTYQFSVDEQQELEALVGNSRLPAPMRSQPAFALAKARESNMGLAGAFADYKRANDLYGPRDFKPDAFLSAVERIKRSVTSESLTVQADAQAVHSDNVRPIFILGMPRSGSTLLEQILSSHSQIEGTQELPVLPSVKQSLHQFCVDRLGRSYLEGLGDIPRDRLTEAGQSYLSQAQLFRAEGTQPFFIDKLPQNFEHIGLIHKILPDAIVIDIRRHPLACGVSLYRQYFASGWAWAYDLSHIGSYYRGYLALMDHWAQLLPGRVLTMRYEDLVADMEAVVRGLLDYVGVPFEAACLSFHKNKRAVRTPSSEQVRQPIYTKSVESWRAVEHELGPLKAALGPELLSRFVK